MLTILIDITHWPQQRVDTLTGGEGDHPAVGIVAVTQFAAHLVGHVPQWQHFIGRLHNTSYRLTLQSLPDPSCITITDGVSLAAC